MDQVKKIVCDDMFMVQSKDEEELMDMAKEHLMRKHDMNPTKDELKKKVEMA